MKKEGSQKGCRYLLYQIAWSVDILFVNILQHKTSPRARRDLDLIRTVISFFEKYDPDHQLIVSYQIIKIIADVAASVLANTPTLPPHMLPVQQAPQPQMPGPINSPSTSDIQGFTPGSCPGEDVNGSATDVLGPLTSLSMSDHQQGFMGLPAGLAQPDGNQFFTGLVDMSDWRLPMDYQPQLWQYDNPLGGRFPGHN